MVGPFIINIKYSLHVVESLLKEMKFQIVVYINYDPHCFISIRRQVNKSKPFKHQEVKGLVESANWLYYPQVTHNEEDMQQESTSRVKYVSVTKLDPLAVVPVVERISPIASHSEMTNKRTFSDAIETEEEDSSQTSKRKAKWYRKQRSKEIKKMKFKGPTFEIKEYAFLEKS